MPLSKREIEKRKNKRLSKRFVNGQVQVLKELGISDEFINRCKVRVMLQCETEEQALNMFSRMKLDYLLGKGCKP